MSIWRTIPVHCSFSILARGVGKQRHTKNSRTPLATLRWEREVVSSEAAEVWGVNPPHLGPVGLELKMYFFGTFESRRPDIDNVEKSLLDGMNGVVYADDCQILYCEKEILFTDQRNEERVEVLIKLG